MQTGKLRKTALVKAAVLAAFVVAAIVAVRFTPRQGIPDRGEAGQSLAGCRLVGAPGLHPDLCRRGLPLHSRHPADHPGGRHFRPLLGISVCLDRGHAGGRGAFLIGRYLGREFAASLIGDRLQKYDDAIERNGFATVLYLRLVYFPFTAHELRHGADQGALPGLSLGHGLGHPGGNLHLHLFRGHHQGSLGQRPVGQLLTWKVFFSLGLFVFSLFIPKIINKLKIWQRVKVLS